MPKLPHTDINGKRSQFVRQSEARKGFIEGFIISTFDIEFQLYIDAVKMSTASSSDKNGKTLGLSY